MGFRICLDVSILFYFDSPKPKAYLCKRLAANLSALKHTIIYSVPVTQSDVQRDSHLDGWPAALYIRARESSSQLFNLFLYARAKMYR